MANYAQVIGWSGKDSLGDTDVNKIISGAEFHTEFTAIENSILTKADINGDASEGFSVLKPTSATDNTSKVPSTNWINTFVTAREAARTNGAGKRTVSTSDASGGANDDIHYKVAP